MPDREKVLADLTEHLKKTEPGDPDYVWAFVRANVLWEAVELLKKQEAAKANTIKDKYGSWWFACGACGHAIDPEDNFCRECGKEIKWDV